MWKVALGLDEESSLSVLQNLRHQCFPWIAAALYWDGWSLFSHQRKAAAQGIILCSWHWTDSWFSPCSPWPKLGTEPQGPVQPAV